MAKIFVSYARATTAQAQLIAETLRAVGHDVWIDDQLLSHGMFSDTIEKELNAADAVVVVWSPDATRSEWVRAEAGRARRAAKIVQVRFERCPLPMPFDQIHVVDLAGWAGDYDVPAWRSVLASIAAVTGAAPGSAPVKAPAPAAAPDRRSERRQVTALSCDLVDAGSLASRLDPEDMMDILDVYQAVRDDVIVHHGGTIAEATNHGVLAYFGYPRADEEEAANAVRAGIAICEGVGRLEVPSGGGAIQVRIGLATGLVVIADLARSNGRGAGVVGETPTLATRLASVAPANGVVVSETTRRITEGLFTWADLGPTPVPGYSDPVKAFVAVAATDATSRSQARSQNRKTPVIGREKELALMKECWALASQGEGQVVLVQGEAGIGKSRLVEAFVAHVAQTPHAQLTWFCAPNYSDSALYPIVDQLTRATGFVAGDSSETRREKLAAVLDRYGATSVASHGVLANLFGIPFDGDDPVAALTPERRKAVTLDSLLAMMDRFASNTPALLIIEDLHWADPTTLELFDRATRLAADRPWLILGTARPEYESRWPEHADVAHVTLNRLSQADAERICSQLGADAVLTTETVRQIIARCDGNPLFVEEMTKSVLEGIAAAPGTGGDMRVAIPNTLHDSLAARLDRLGSAKQVASLGAAIGRRFTYELLAAVAPQPAVELRQALRELTRADILERSGVPPNSHYEFKHALIRDAAYESLLKREREALHGRIATALREQFPDTLAAEPALVAYHLTESGAIAEAVPLWAEAGHRSATQGAHAEAVSHLQTALGLVRRLPMDAARVQLELQLLLGLAVSLAGSRGYSVPELGQVLAEARAICDALGNVAGLIVVLRAICAFRTVEADFPSAEEAARRCSEIAAETGSIVHRIEADTALGFVLACRGELAAARPLLENAVKDYVENDGASLEFLQPQRPVFQSLAQLLLLLQAMGDKPAAERALADMARHVRTAGANFDVAVGRTYIATYSVMSHEYARALEEATAALAICEECGYETFAALALANKGLSLARLGDLATGLPMAARGIAETERLGIRSMHTYWLAELAVLQCEAGDPATALATVERGIEHALCYDDKFYLSPAYRHRATILRQLPGDHEAEAVAALNEACAIADAQGAAGFSAQARALLPNPVHQ